MTSLLHIFLGETLGTMILIILGNGVVANVLYKRTAGSGGGIIAITAGWAFAVLVGIIVANSFSTGAHLNPAITISQWVAGKISIAHAMTYFASELLGATIGQICVVIFYWKHAQEEDNQNAILSTHCTKPTHEDGWVQNLFSEFLGTVVLITVATVAVIAFTGSSNGGTNNLMSYFGPFAVALTVFAIGLSLGGTTGYAINPARDLMPRLVYQLTPYKYKKSANWGYAWVPVVAPLTAGVVVGAFSRFIS